MMAKKSARLSCSDLATKLSCLFLPLCIFLSPIIRSVLYGPYTQKPWHKSTRAHHFQAKQLYKNRERSHCKSNKKAKSQKERYHYTERERERERDEGKEEQSHIVERREERGQLQPWFLFGSDPITGCHL